VEKDTAPAKVTFSAAGIAAILVVGAWGGPAFGSSGVDTEILDDDVKVPALAEAVNHSDIDSTEEVDETQDEAAAGDEDTAIITRLPGVSDAALPSFRRQMYRTDI